MKQNAILTLILSAAVLLGGCTKTELTGEGGGGKLDPSKTAPVELTTISMAGGETSQAAQSRAGGEYAMPVGSTFRLYAFEKDRTDMGELIASRSYTIETTEGVAVLDAGQDKLYLPLGEVDIYLVGPVTAYVGADLYDIASVNGVVPQRGVDLIASKTSVTITAGSNSLALNALEHKMTKAEIVVATNEKGAYENLILQKATVTAQATTGTFTFGENGGSITPTTGTDLYTMPAPVDITAAGGLPTWSCMDYLIPQPERQFKIEVEFTTNQKSADGVTFPTIKYRQSGLITATMQGGSYQRFTASPLTPVDIIWRLSVLPWTDKVEPNVPTGNQDLLFDFRGTDAPITIDGKQYWPDRSGNGNHALMEGTMTYDAAGKFYYQTGAKASGKLKLPDNLDLNTATATGYTFEIALTTESPSQQGIVIQCQNGIDDGRDFFVHIPYDNNGIYFDTGGRTAGRIYYSRLFYANQSADKDLMKILQTYTFRIDKGNNELKIFRNGRAAYNGNGTQDHIMPRALAVCNLCSAITSDTKVYALRMYRKRLSDGQIAANAAADKCTYAGINDNTDYVKPGLILDLRGDIAPKKFTYGGREIDIWEDQSPAKNHAEIIGTGISHNVNTYTFTNPVKGGNNEWLIPINGYMRLISSLGKNNDYTVEVVAKGLDNMKTTLFYFANEPRREDKLRQWYMHYPANADVICGTNAENLSSVANSLPYLITTAPQQWSFTRRLGVTNGTQVYENGRFIAQRTSRNSLQEMSYCLIGAQVGPTETTGQAFAGEVQAVRFYNRALTEQEMRHNYSIDKLKYSIEPVK